MKSSSRSGNRADFLSRYGPWAVITGASSGLGTEFARQLAQARLNLVITARRKPILEKLERELADQYGVQIRCVAADLMRPEGREELMRATQDIDVGLLVSNAGHVVPGSFLGNDPNDYDAVIRLNIVTPMHLAHHFGRKMAIRGAGGIILTSSITAFGSVPFMANYAGTKAYLASFGAALRFELGRHGVHVSVLAPGPTDTPMATQTSALRKSIYMMKVRPVVAESLRRLPKAPVVIPGFLYKCGGFLMTRVLTRWGFTVLWGHALQYLMEPWALEPKLEPQPESEPSDDDDG